MTLSELRASIYNIIDNLIKTGTHLDIKRNGVTVRIFPLDNKKKQRIRSKNMSWPKRKGFVGKPDDLLNLDWSNEWKID